MKNYFILTLVALSVSFTESPAYDWQKFVPQGIPTPSNINTGNTYYGMANINGQELNGLTVFGTASIQKSNISGQTEINGPLSASASSFDSMQINGTVKGLEIQFNQMDVNGPVVLTNSTAKGVISINGILIANKSTLQDVSIAATEVALNDSSVQNIVVKENNRQKRPQYVFIRGNSTVTGTISFEQGNGIVVLEAGASINDNQVIGGIIKKE